MGGLNWNAFEMMVELFGVQDVEVFMRQLVAIRESQGPQAPDDEGVLQ